MKKIFKMNVMILHGLILIVNSGCLKLIKKSDLNQSAPPQQVDQVEYVNIEIKGEMSLSEPLTGKFKQLILREGAVLKTNGFAIDINVDEIRAEGGKIISFIKGTTAPIGESGRSGGVIKIIAHSAKGILQIEQNGENGGAGVPALTPDISLRGKDGEKNSDAGEIAFRKGLFPGLSCTRGPNQPTDGAQGLAGHPGGNGGAGGSTGTVFLDIESDQGFSLSWSRERGIGGAGAVGGAGGEGGNPGEQVVIPGCSPTSTAQKGTTGPKGSDGITGQSGTVDLICVKLANNKTCWQ